MIPSFAPAFLALSLLPASPVQELALAPRVTRLPDEEVVLPLDLSTGHAVVEVRIDGLGPFALLLDTGASGTALDRGLAEELGLPVVGETTLGDPSDPEANSADLVVVPSLDLGPAHFEELVAVAWSPPARLGGLTTRGILGLPTFEDCLFTLDYAKRELRIRRGALPAPEDDPLVVAIHRRDMGLVSVPIELPGGIVLDAHLDSGNMDTPFVPDELEARLDVVDGSRRTGRGQRASGSVEFAWARIRGELRVGPLTLHDPELRFDSRLDHANVGRTFFEAAEVTVDLANERMRIRPYRTDAAGVVPAPEDGAPRDGGSGDRAGDGAPREGRCTHRRGG